MTGNLAASVIMTVYNGDRYLAQAINSILNQSLPNFEFVIVDDGSEDCTPAILAQAKADPRVKVVSQSHLGRARALNVAWNHTRASYVANLDADDLALPTRLERQLLYLQQHPQVGLLGTACRVLDENSGGESIKRLPLTDPELRRALVRRNLFVHSSVMMPRRVLREVGGYDESLGVAVDYELWIRIADRYRLASLPHVLTVKRVHRDAYFQNRVPTWKKYKTRAMISWRAWLRFSRHVAELRFVLDSTVRWLYTWARDAWRSTRQP